MDGTNLNNSSVTDNGMSGTGYKQELKRTLTFSQLLIFGLAYIGPTTIMTYLGVVGVMTHGMLCLAYIIASVAMSFTAFSYAKMVSVYPIAGSSYSYTQRTFNPFVGFITGWVILLDYAFLPIVCNLLIGLYANLMFPQIPLWVFVTLGGLICGAINYRGVDIMAKVNSVLVAGLVIMMVAIFIFMIKFVATGSGEATFFNPQAIVNMVELDKIGVGTVVTGASILVLCFLGIDAATTVAEEAINPRKNVGKAIIFVTITVSIYFIVYSYMMQTSWRRSQVFLGKRKTFPKC